MSFKSLPKSINILKCSCNSSKIIKRSASTVTTTPSTSTPSSSTPTLLASSLLSRPPLTLPPLHPLEKSYYNYQQKISRSLAKPVSTSSEWFFKNGTTAQKSFLNFDKEYSLEIGNEGLNNEIEVALVGREESVLEAGVVDGGEKKKEQEKKEESIKSLQRKSDRTLYLLVSKKVGKIENWSFPQGPITTGESLLEAAQRQLYEKIGNNVDIWPIGRVPAGSFTSPSSTKLPSSNTFFLPMRIIRGSPDNDVIKKGLGGGEFAWLTKEEIKEKVKVDYWEAVEPMLSEL